MNKYIHPTVIIFHLLYCLLFITQQNKFGASKRTPKVFIHIPTAKQMLLKTGV